MKEKNKLKKLHNFSFLAIGIQEGSMTRVKNIK